VPNVAMKHDISPAKVILDALGDISGYEVGPRHVLIATYRRPEKTYGGIVLTQSNLDEDLHQSKVGLVVKVGNDAQFNMHPLLEGDWVVIRPSDCWALEVNKVHCRHVHDALIKAKIPEPGMIW
jgi:co-chaperonin GroES (HSP10)